MDKLPTVGDYTTSVGVLTYNYQATQSYYVSQKIDELSTLLTAGRLSKENKQNLANAHAFFQLVHGIEYADRVVLQLIAAAPEFHTSSLGKIMRLGLALFSPLLTGIFFFSAKDRCNPRSHAPYQAIQSSVQGDRLHQPCGWSG